MKMRYVHALFIILILLVSCSQNRTDEDQEYEKIKQFVSGAAIIPVTIEASEITNTTEKTNNTEKTIGSITAQETIEDTDDVLNAINEELEIDEIEEFANDDILFSVNEDWGDII